MASVPVAPAIEAHSLARRYGRTFALQPTTFSVPAGSVVALIGHNGAGKTTLLKLLMNLIRPSAGDATVLGASAISLGGDSFLRIGYVSENQELPGWMTVRAFLRYQSGFYPQWDDADLITRFQLPLRRKLKHLSRGQRMKAALASVLAFSPELLLLDEPLSGLDPLVRDELLEALRERTAAAGTTVLFSSHDLAEIESFATHVAFMHQGRLLFLDTMPAVRANFRTVTATFAEESAELPAAISALTQPNPANPGSLPSWLRLERLGGSLTLIQSRAASEDLTAQLRDAGLTPQMLHATPLTLREIFLAIAKSAAAQPPAPELPTR